MILSSTEIVNPTNNNSTFFKTSKAPPPKKPPKLSLKTSRKKVFEYVYTTVSRSYPRDLSIKNSPEKFRTFRPKNFASPSKAIWSWHEKRKKNITPISESFSESISNKGEKRHFKKPGFLLWKYYIEGNGLIGGNLTFRFYLKYFSFPLTPIKYRLVYRSLPWVAYEL